MERETGIEPAASSLARKRSTGELLPLGSDEFPKGVATLICLYLLFASNRIGTGRELFRSDNSPLLPETSRLSLTPIMLTHSSAQIVR